MEISLFYNDAWENSKDTKVRGNVFVDGEYHSTAEFADQVSKVSSEIELEELLKRTNGFFSVIHNIDDKVLLAADHLRSWPLYYAVTDDIYVSDSGKWVHASGARRGYDPIAATEQLFTEYVSGRDTISRDVKQIQSGEIVVINDSGPTPEITTERWTESPSVDESHPAGLNELDHVMENVFERFLRVVDGRTILLGLSSGYDSRLIALMLYRLGYEDVITYTRNRSSYDSGEFSSAKSIAEDLGFEHLAIQHSHSDYREFYESEEWGEFYESVGVVGDLAVPSGYITLKKIKQSDIVPDDVVVVRGHHAMGGAGQLPNWVRDRKAISKKEFLEIMWRNYSRWRTTRGLEKENMKEIFYGRILDRISIDLFRTSDAEPISSVIDGVESWYSQERVPKLLLRNFEYDYFGYDRWIPLWDREYVNFVSKTSYKDRIGKRIHKQYVQSLDEQIRGKQGREEPNSDLRNKAKGIISNLPPQFEYSIRNIHSIYRPYNTDYGSDPRFGIVTEEEFDQMNLKQVDQASLFFLTLYRDGYFEPDEELDWALDYT